jgi:hypothetical protein
MGSLSRCQTKISCSNLLRTFPSKPDRFECSYSVSARESFNFHLFARDDLADETLVKASVLYHIDDYLDAFNHCQDQVALLKIEKGFEFVMT